MSPKVGPQDRWRERFEGRGSRERRRGVVADGREQNEKVGRRKTELLSVDCGTGTLNGGCILSYPIPRIHVYIGKRGIRETFHKVPRNGEQKQEEGNHVECVVQKIPHQTNSTR